MCRQLEPYYSEIGRPSVDPALMLRMLIVGYSYGVRSERQHQRFGLEIVVIGKRLYCTRVLRSAYWLNIDCAFVTV
jgi:hypothetical protein